MKNIYITVIKAFKIVFKNKRYVAVATMFSFFIYFLAIVTHKFEFISFALKSDLFNAMVKFKLVFGSILSLDTNFVSVLSFWVVIALAVVAGINIAMLIYLLRRQASARHEAGASVFGVIAGMLGIGCAACGSIILTSLFGLGFTVSLIAYLPLDGGEFMILALLALLVSIYYVARKIVDPMVCKPKRPSEVIQ